MKLHFILVFKVLCSSVSAVRALVIWPEKRESRDGENPGINPVHCMVNIAGTDQSVTW